VQLLRLTRASSSAPYPWTASTHLRGVASVTQDAKALGVIPVTLNKTIDEVADEFHVISAVKWELGQLSEVLQLSKGHTFFPGLACKMLDSVARLSTDSNAVLALASGTTLPPEILGRPLAEQLADGRLDVVLQTILAQLKLLHAEGQRSAAAAAYYCAFGSRCILGCLPSNSLLGISTDTWIERPQAVGHCEGPVGTKLSMPPPTASELRAACRNPGVVCTAAAFLQAASVFVDLDPGFLGVLLAETLHCCTSLWQQKQYLGSDAPADALVRVVGLVASCGALNAASLSLAVQQLLDQGQEAVAAQVLTAAARPATGATAGPADSRKGEVVDQVGGIL
jgi:hypothetical protein